MPILVVSDIHANLAALEAVLADAGPVTAVWSLGDMVGYGPRPNQVLERLQEIGARCVAGNHEWAALGRLDLAEFNGAAAAAAEWTRDRLTPASRAYLEGLPVRWDDEATAVHGSPRDPIWEYILSGATAQANFAHFQGGCCFFGHTHVPAAYRTRATFKEQYRDGRVDPGQRLRLSSEHRYLLNPGSVGQPRDGDPRASYLLWDPIASEVVWCRVEYDVAATQVLMRAEDLPDVLWQRLSVGR